jgi:hypothetical protein
MFLSVNQISAPPVEPVSLEQFKQQCVATRTVDSLNTEMAKAMTGQKTDFHGVFEGAATSLAKTGLQTAEGSILKGIKGLGGGHAKADGYHMWIDNLASTSDPTMSLLNSLSPKPKIAGPGGLDSSMISSGSKGLLGMLNDSDWATSGWLGNFFGKGGMFGGHFATGGDVMGGVPVEVGELGPERFVPPSNGRSVPTKDLQSSPSIGYIGARGTDPALTRENVARTLQTTHAQAVGDAQRSMADRARRRPQ